MRIHTIPDETLPQTPSLPQPLARFHRKREREGKNRMDRIWDRNREKKG